MRLDRAQVGFVGRLVSLMGDDWLTVRLRELGFVPGASIELQSRLVSGEPLVIRVGSARYALRRVEANCLEVEAS